MNYEIPEFSGTLKDFDSLIAQGEAIIKTRKAN